MTLLQCTNVSKIFTVGTEKIIALNNINLTIEQGELMVIAGHSGSGKSTLLHLLGALEHPSEGTITAKGENINHWSDAKLSHYRNRELGFVFQDFKLHPFLNCLENVELPLQFSSRHHRSHGVGEDQGLADQAKRPHGRAKELLKLVGLQHRLQHKPHELSGGQRQRVAIARALINQPSILLADEPTGNLDFATGKQIIELLVNINQDFNTTVIIVTHDPAITQKADRIVHLKDGVMIEG